MPKKGGRRKKSRTHKGATPEGATILASKHEEDDVMNDALLEKDMNVPRTIVARSGKVRTYVAELIKDLRKLMEPNTASNLRERSYNKMRDYVAVAGKLGVTHLLIISQTNTNVILRVGKVPGGPTLHFKILQYTLCQQVRATQKRPFDSQASYFSAPLIVLNNFGQSEESHIKLMKVTFQHIFPTINVKTVKLAECRRVVLFHYVKEEGSVEMRHYAIKATPVGVSRSIKRVLQSKVPDLGKISDISEFIEYSSGLTAGDASDSEAEDEASHVTLSEKIAGAGNGKTQRSAMRLVECGPRIKMELFKVEGGLNEGDVLYHKFVEKDPREAAATKARVEKAKSLKEQRKAEQDGNVKRKREREENEKAAKKQKAEEKRAKRAEEKGDDDDEKSDDENKYDEQQGGGGDNDSDGDNDGELADTDDEDDGAGADEFEEEEEEKDESDGEDFEEDDDDDGEGSR